MSQFSLVGGFLRERQKIFCTYSGPRQEHPSWNRGSHGGVVSGSTSSDVVSSVSGYTYDDTGCRVFKVGIQN